MLTKTNLEALLLDVESSDDDALLEQGRRLYKDTYLNQGHVGVHKTHDGKLLLFYEQQFDHAFWSSPDKHSGPHLKVRLARERIARMLWIGPLVAGEVLGSACWQGSGTGSPGRHQNRLYVIPNELYVAWLEPRTAGGWKFWTAYRATRDKIVEYQQGRSLIKRWEGEK
jgi:hypothetical protein